MSQEQLLPVISRLLFGEWHQLSSLPLQVTISACAPGTFSVPHASSKADGSGRRPVALGERLFALHPRRHRPDLDSRPPLRDGCAAKPSRSRLHDRVTHQSRSAFPSPLGACHKFAPSSKPSRPRPGPVPFRLGPAEQLVPVEAGWSVPPASPAVERAVRSVPH